MKYLPCMGALLLAQCVRGQGSPPPPEDKSIVFPESFGEAQIMGGEPGNIYELDGAVLQALLVASKDFLPSDSKSGPCWRRPEGHLYRIIRRDNILFVQIRADTSSCMRGLMMLDYGAEYAISMDGQILRRLLPGHPSASPPPSPAVEAAVPGVKDMSSLLGATWGSAEIALPPRWLDAGLRPAPGPAIPDGGVSLDGGVPAGP